MFRATIPGVMSTKPHNIFISWSGPRSKHVASAVRQWLPDVIQSARPWMSDSDIDKGSRGIEEISKALETIEVGISCLTPENLTAPWLLFEGGALSKRIGNKARLCTYLLGGLQKGDVPQPLGMFQHTVAEKAETRKMLDSINQAINPTEPVNLDRTFDKWWPDLEDAIKKMPEPEIQVAAQRPEREMVAEILDIVRSMRPAPPQFGEIWSIPEGQGNLSRLKIYLKNPMNTFVCGKCGSTAGIAAADEGMKCVTCGALNSSMLMIPEPPIESKAE
jgi:hypothetical protein